MLYKNLFLLWNNKYFLILPLYVISTQPCISRQTVHLPGGEEGFVSSRLKDVTLPIL